MSICENCGIKSDEIELMDSAEPPIFLCSKCSNLPIEKIRFNFKNKQGREE